MLRRVSNNGSGGEGDALIAERPGGVGSVPDGVERRRSGRSGLDARRDGELSAFREDEQFSHGLTPDDFMGETGSDRRAGDERSMAHLRARREWTVAPEDALAPENLASRFFGKNGALKSPRWQALLIAVISAMLAIFVGVQNQPAPAPAPVPAMAEPVVEVKAEPRLQVLVATENIRIGQRLSAASVSWAEWPETMVQSDYITQTQAPDALTNIAESAARYEIFAGEPVREAKLVRASNGYLSTILEGGMRGVSVSVEANAASGGFIRPDDHVDVIMTKNGAAGLTSETVLHNVRVLAINAQLGESSTEASQPEGVSPDGKANVFVNQAIATLALNSKDAEVLVNASAAGSLSLVLRSVDDFVESSRSDQQGVNQAIRLSSPFWNNSSTQSPVR